MKITKQIQEKHDEIEKEVSRLRTKGARNWDEEESFKENDLTEQLATLRWVLDKSAEWNQAGLRDT
jgi:hypothetical protein